MEEPERLPCPTCRQPADILAELCLGCGASLLVDVVLGAPIADGRVRYRLARSLSSLPGAPPLGAIQNALAASPPAAARGVTRGYAHAVLPILGENDVHGTIEKHVTPRQRGGFPLGTVALGVAAVALLAVTLALAYFGWQRLLGRMAPPDVRVAAPEALPPSPVAKPAAGRTTRELAQAALAAAASLRCRESVGSGFFVAPDLVVTNAHVLCRVGETIQVGLSDERKFTGQVIHRDDVFDLAVVRAEGASVPPMPLGDIGDAAVGDRVMIVGSPVGLDFTVQEGSISSLQRSANKMAYFQLDAKVSPGNSGGPVVDSQGRVLGVVSMKVSGEGVEGIGLAIPINYVYGSQLGFVSPPSTAAAASQAFQHMVTRAMAGTGDDMREARAGTPEGPPGLDDRPLLVAGRVDQYDRLVVGIIRVTEFPPGYEEVTLRVWSGTEAFCTIKGDVRTWVTVEPGRAGSGLEPRAAAALRQMARGQTLYMGESPLRWDLCDRTKMRSGIEIELQGASPLADRLKVR